MTNCKNIDLDRIIFVEKVQKLKYHDYNDDNKIIDKCV